MKRIINKELIFTKCFPKKLRNKIPDETYLKIFYKAGMGRELDLDNPQTFNEKLQWLKLHDRKPEYTTMVDKYEVKKYIADKIGEKYVIPTLGVWNSFDEIDFESLPQKYVLKCTHDSGGLVVVNDKSKFNKAVYKKKLEKSLKNNYYYFGREWPYKNVQPRIIAEQYLEEVEDSTNKTGYDSEAVSCFELQREQGLLDYKFMCFNGEVKALFLDIGVIGKKGEHAKEYYRNIYDRSGELLPFKETREHYPQKVILPDNLQEMVDIAECLSAGILHLRVDLYNINGKIKVGELTFYHGSGTTNFFYPEKWNKIFGDWIELPK